MMKKTIVFLLLLLSLAMFAACNRSKTPEPDPVPEHTHTFGEWVEETAATCTQPGQKGHKTCTGCNKNFDAEGVEIADLVISAKGHAFGVWTTDQKPTCTEQGSRSRVCTVCGAKEEEDVPAIEHTYNQVVEQPATVNEPGVMAHYQCPVCKKLFVDNGEDKKEVTADDLVLKPTGHQYGKLIQEQPATCTESGHIAYYDCPDCGKKFDKNFREITNEKDLILPAGHQFGEWEEGKAANCGDNGEKAHKTCSVCGKHFDAEGKEIPDIVIPASGEHTYQHFNEVPATEDDSGVMEHDECTVCHHCFVDDGKGNKTEVSPSDLEIPPTEAPPVEEDDGHWSIVI